MGNQRSETREQYSAPPGIRSTYHFQDAAGLNLPQNHNLNDHHVEGPSKVIIYRQHILFIANILLSRVKIELL